MNQPSLSENMIEKNKKPLMIAGAVIVLITIGVVIVQGRKSAHIAEGWNEYYQAKQGIQTELEKIAKEMPADIKTDKKDPMGQAPQDAQKVAFQRFDVDAKLGASTKKMETVAQKYNGNIVGWEASLELGDLYFDHGQSEKAIPWYQKALSQADSPLNKTLSASALAAALENGGKFDESIQHLEKALNLGVTYQKGELLLSLARVHALKKDPTKARSVADRIIAELANTEYSKQAEVIKSQLE